jgi:hypothetical protein
LPVLPRFLGTDASSIFLRLLRIFSLLLGSSWLTRR